MAKCLMATFFRRSFSLTKFFSNVPGAKDSYPKAEIMTMHLDKQPLNNNNSESDCFVSAFESWQSDSTRRILLTYFASLLDLLGLVASCVFPSKILIQDLILKKADWDEAMTPDELSRWKYCLDELQDVQRLRVNHCLSPIVLKGISNPELNAFSDASESGYGATVYLRFLSSSRNAKCSLQMTKSYGASLKSVTIPVWNSLEQCELRESRTYDPTDVSDLFD